jgi:ComF family protein
MCHGLGIDMKGKILGILDEYLAWLLPQYCLLCRSTIPSYSIQDIRLSHIPLCESCRSKIDPIQGARCSKCGKELYSESEICSICREKDSIGVMAYPLFMYRGQIASLLKEYKNHERKSLAGFWAYHMEEVLCAQWLDRTLVPVPPRPEKIRFHRWDQVEAIVGVLESRGWNVCRCLERTSSFQQKRLSRGGRRENADQGYAISPGFSGTMPESIVIIDDVYTTGSTVSACARILRENGAKDVLALVIAAD